MRIVFDSNVLIAAFATHGMCHVLLERCLQRHLVVLSEDILEEMDRKLRRKIKAPPATVLEALSYLRAHCLLERPVPVPPSACRDPKDLPILGVAVAARADCLVTGDADLLTLKRHHETDILSPRQLHDRLREDTGGAGAVLEPVGRYLAVRRPRRRAAVA